MKRVVCLNCMDGRTQLPVIHWIKKTYDVEAVDMVTEPGMDGLLADDQFSTVSVEHKINISIDKNNADQIFVVGHYDCKGNPVDDKTHKEHIEKSVKRLQMLFSISVTGLWVNDRWEVEVVNPES